jgi:hypothetical protein
MQRHAHQFLIALAISVVGFPSRADDLPRSGDYKVLFTGINTSPMKPLPTGPNRTVTISQSTMTALNVTGGGFLHNMAGRCAGMATMDNEAKTFENHGYCVYADAGGDQIFEKYDYPAQPQGTTPHGTGSWTGGTGKFAGISGEIEILNARVNPMTEGVAQFTGTKTGRYNFEAVTASAK